MRLIWQALALAAGLAKPRGRASSRGKAARLAASIAKDEKPGRGHFPKAAAALAVKPALPARRRNGSGCWLLAAAAVCAGAGASAWAADTQRGAELYRSHCAQCHGAGGRPQLPGTPDFTTPTALLRPDMTLLNVVREGRGAMPAYAVQLRDREILDIVAHLRTLR